MIENYFNASSFPFFHLHQTFTKRRTSTSRNMKINGDSSEKQLSPEQQQQSTQFQVHSPTQTPSQENNDGSTMRSKKRKSFPKKKRKRTKQQKRKNGNFIEHRHQADNTVGAGESRGSNYSSAASNRKNRN